ncbi:gamma-glutamylcyclotransferase family protein [Sphingobium sp.]|uniref:gamma-glutamylcyclotransferase family protein n=1 Tax=Sphingobium sp. TaxID=1912891 RepID=UPI002C287CD8|nr:gamma-glutamylcyclotransferase family protein [Sphingobium sp.]HUD93190.1 gamma-glutamylcyclotransferase family protein [Sphingobium sp.]
MGDHFLFVYGTLRADFDGPMARRLRSEARLVGPATAHGTLYRIAEYPGFVSEGDGTVAGDLFALDDAEATLAWLDDYEECSGRFPAPHEYCREWMTVDGPDGEVMAWVYVYAWDVAGREQIADGDFLAGGRGG